MNWEVWVMNSKTSLSERFFSKALIKADLRNNWMWSVVMTVFLVLNVLSLPDTEYYTYYSSFYDNYDRFLNYCGLSFFIALFFGLFIGTRLFTYLDKPNSVSCMHGLPFSRRKLYLSHIASGGILIGLPALAVSVLMTFMSFGNQFITLRCIAAFLAIFLIYALLSFAISAFAMTVCGNVVVSTLFSCTIAILPAALLVFVFGLCEVNIYGFAADSGILENILNFLYVFPEALFPWRFSVYLGFILAFFTGGYFVYKIRPLENCEEVVAFKKLHGLFIYAVGLVSGMIGYLFFMNLAEIENPIGMLPLGIIGVAVSTMIAKKSVNLKGSLRYIAIFTAAIGIVSAIFAFDLLGIEKRVPNAQEVEYVSVENNYRHRNVGEFVPFAAPDRNVEDPDDIELICNLHKAYISDKVGSKNPGGKHHTDDSFVFVYHLKNGSTLKRRYSYLSDENYEKYLIPVRNIEEYKAYAYPIIDSADKELISVRINDDRFGGHETLFSGKSQEAKLLYDAVTSDMTRLSREQLGSSGTLRIRFAYYTPGYFVSDPEHILTNEDKEKYQNSEIIYINENFTQTIKVLSQLGIPEGYEEDVEKISSIVASMDFYNKKTDYESAAPYDTKSGAVSGVRITDPEEIREIYDLCRYGTKTYFTANESKNLVEINFVFLNDKDEQIWSNYLRFLPEDLPASLAATK